MPPERPQDRTRAILTSKLGAPAKMILVVIADYMSDNHLICWPAVDSIADRAGYGERQTREILSGLEVQGIIHRWDGEHKCRDIAISWEALARFEPAPETRGGTRQAKIATAPAKIAAQPAMTAGTTTGKDCHPDRQRLPPRPAKIATPTGNLCPRSDHEATMKRPDEATSPLPPTPHPDLRSPPRRWPFGAGGSGIPIGEPPAPEPDLNLNGRSIPGDIPALLWGCRAGRRSAEQALLGAGIESTAQLLRTKPRGPASLEFTPGLGAVTLDAIEAHLQANWGIGLGAMYGPGAARLTAAHTTVVRTSRPPDAVIEGLRAELGATFDDNGWRNEDLWAYAEQYGVAPAK